ncbi:hypothetical protein AaE_004139 [Aphanomyces astaci]|uniref:sphingomyelin phosphodiesterase n=1 Tax=Aphanomyces astaci TaxID=112090 RepID=A0A6A5A5I2_APHAT|nr:hypothetical protein AaE_004139 [Aphanomyces astaci]
MHVRVLSWNVFLRPPGIQQPGGGDHKDLRLEFIMRKVIQYDVVLLQEMFAIGSSRLHRLLSFANDHGLAYHAGSVYPSLWSRQLVDGGLLILSRYPICQTKSHQFRDSCGSDALAAKGVVYAQLQIESQGTLLDVFTTHTQAGQGQVATSIRWRQIQELAWFVHTTRTDATTPAILGGDFNLDARHNVDFAGDPANPVITKCAESVSYKRMLQLFSMRSHDSVANVLGAAHDVTNANGHGVLAQTWSKEQVNDMGKCIDYLFVFEPSRGGSHGDGEPSSVVHAAVDTCALDRSPLIDGGVVEQMIGSVTHLSDHWAITATLRFPLQHNVQSQLSCPLQSHQLDYYKWQLLWWPFKATAVIVIAGVGVVAAGITVTRYIVGL